MGATMDSVRGGDQPDATGDDGWAAGDAGRGWITGRTSRKAASRHERSTALEYDRAMPAMSMPIRPRGLAAMLGWNRVLVTMGVSAALGLLLSIAYVIPVYIVIARAVIVGLIAMLVYGLVEQWPTRLPRWAARWVVQLVAMVAVMPLAAFTAYWITAGGNPQISEDAERSSGYFLLLFGGVLFAPWIAVTRSFDSAMRSRAIRHSPSSWSAANSNARHSMRASGCCRRRSNRISCSTRSRTCRPSSTPVRRRPHRC